MKTSVLGCRFSGRGGGTMFCIDGNGCCEADEAVDDEQVGDEIGASIFVCAFVI